MSPHPLPAPVEDETSHKAPASPVPSVASGVSRRRKAIPRRSLVHPSSEPGILFRFRSLVDDARDLDAASFLVVLGKDFGSNRRSARRHRMMMMRRKALEEQEAREKAAKVATTTPPPSDDAGDASDDDFAAYIARTQPSPAPQRRQRTMSTSSSVTYAGSSFQPAPELHASPRAGAKECASCGTRKTPMWRDDPEGTPLCNACGIRYKKYRVRCPGFRYIPRKDENPHGKCSKCKSRLVRDPRSR
eukprot:Opistho-1_new@105629